MCNKKIPKARLKILPDTDLCVKCSEAIGGDYETKIIEENLGNSLVSSVHRIKREIEPLN